MAKAKRGRPPRYPFGTMKVGDEHIIAAPAGKVGAAACMFAKTGGRNWKFMCRTNGKGTRVWRIQ